MNLVTLISGTVIVMAILELLLHGMNRMKKSLFRVAVLLAFAGFTSKYYYGPDITTYAPLYDGTENIFEFVQGNFVHSYEHGFVCFCAICQTFGMTFWWFTAMVSLLIFLAIYLVLDKLEDKRVLALAVILALVPDLVYAQFRQSMAVSFFVFAVLSAEKWQKSNFISRRAMVSAILFGFISTTMHKSAIFIVWPTFLYYLLQPLRLHKNTWDILLVLIIILAIVPTQGFVDGIIEQLGEESPVAKSIKLHLAFSKLRQSNLLIYGMAIILLMHFARQRERRGAMVAAAAMGMIIVVLFYQYYFMLNRLKSYFVILVVYYIFREMHRAGVERMPFVAITRQVCEIVLLVFVSYKVYAYDRNSREEGNLLEACTIFDLVENDADDVRKAQIDKAERFWHTQFLKSDSQNQSETIKQLPVK